MFSTSTCTCPSPPFSALPLPPLTSCTSLRNIIFALFVLRHFRKAIRQLRGRGLLATLASFYRYLQRVAYGIFLGLPWIRSKVQGQVDEALKKLEDKLVPKGPGVTRYTSLPKDGLEDAKIKDILKEYVFRFRVRGEGGEGGGADVWAG